jgi:hypothetical protein
MSPRAIECISPATHRILPAHFFLFTFRTRFRRNFCGVWVVCKTMKLEHETVSASDWNTMDRRVIQVDVAPTQAGIAAALRRAFEAAASEPCDRDFDELLRRLN